MYRYNEKIRTHDDADCQGQIPFTFSFSDVL